MPGGVCTGARYIGSMYTLANRAVCISAIHTVQLNMGMYITTFVYYTDVMYVCRVLFINMLAMF